MRDETVGDERWRCSERITARGRSYLPDGVSSPIRTFGEVSSPALIIKKGRGGIIWDVDGNEYVDFMLGLGPMILGHAHDTVVTAIREQTEAGTVFACSTELEYELAQMIVEALRFDQLRFVCSGTEATMTAVRLARAFTGRRRLVKFHGSYHGHADALLAGGSAKTMADPDDAVLVCTYNDADEIRNVFTKYGSELAAVIVEPYACNMGLVVPASDFMAALRDGCDACGALLIFDEVVTGFRLRYGSAGDLLGITPDLITIGKIIGGGSSIGAYAGRRDVMRLLDGVGGIFQGGTFAGNPLSMAAGVATLRELRDGDVYAQLESLGKRLEAAFQMHLSSDMQESYRLMRVGSIASVVPVVKAGVLDNSVYWALHRDLLTRGFLLPPSVDEPIFLCSAHSGDDVTRLATGVADGLSRLSTESRPEI
jgi:glutamate-1-semialdehyde 2,1-aminomutase